MNRRILLIDDTPAIHEDYKRILGQAPVDNSLEDLEEALFGSSEESTSIAFEYESAFQGEEGLSKVREALQKDQPYAMAFVDMRMPPGWDGCETIRQIWKEDPDLQIVICTAYSDSSWEDVLSKLDVRDRLLILKKPFDTIEVYQLANALTTKWEMTRQAAHKLAEMEKLVTERTRELSDAMIQLSALATTDGLTGVKNRRALEESLSESFEWARQEHTPLSVVLLDVDWFKRYNDNYGHLAGDEVLKRVGAVLRAEAGDAMTVGRFGGEEFMIVLPGLDSEEANAVAEAMRQAISRTAFEFETVSASFGISTLTPSISSPAGLIAQADKALYISKERGRNRITNASIFDRDPVAA